MSTEVLAIIISAVGVVVTPRHEHVRRRRLDGPPASTPVAADVTDLKISVARLEGPPRHLLTTGRG